MDCMIYVAKIKVLISCAVTAQLICTFVSHVMQKACLLITPLFFCFCSIFQYKMGLRKGCPAIKRLAQVNLKFLSKSYYFLSDFNIRRSAH